MKHQMNKPIKLFLIIIFISNLVFAQSKENQTSEILYDSTYQVSINHNLPTLIGKFKITEMYNGEAHSDLYELKFVNPYNGLLFSQVVDTGFDCGYWPEFKLADFNFDGYLDLWTVISRDTRAQPRYHFWIFNTQTNTFEINQEFTDSLVCDLDLNPRDSTISSL